MGTYSAPKHPEQLLRESGKLREIFKKVQELRQLDRIVADALDPDLRGHCKIANHQGARLKLVVESAVWATRLRYAIPRLLKNLQKNPAFAALKTIDYRINTLNAPPEPVRQTNTLSPDTRQAIRSAAQYIDHPQLKQALERLGDPD